ncbi:PQ-loop repeat protein [Talaromyces pinophilus]|uniref:PQ-loop repeat protein n=1 Tax=Talaromyces pinophilus TaxID=128442 RepID=A0A6V8HDL9_TALPI|nr:hypothetical protein PENOC_065040 [Penicillium occitanis (nom. inval.)]PCH05750.1 Hypothetical protein PENO1_020670 [Penicillium occitanis (nom. inval.)]GAM39580.1 PQ-loop repeat protein [Talaromyces pinophilus]
MGSVSPQCQDLELPHGVSFNFILSLLILVGILISYLPQHIRIIRLRSSFGLSPYFVLLGTTSGTAAFANILVLPRSARDVACCREISGVSCFAGLLGIFQVGVQCLSFYVILLLFLIYFPRATSLVNPTAFAETETESDGNDATDSDKQPSYSTAVIVSITCLAHAVIVLIISLTMAIKHPSHLQTWANILGIMSAVLASIQYFPQIWTTFRLQKVGSLSIPMMCIQTPGSLVWAASLAQRLGAEGWSAWGVYVITALLQGTLLVMGIYFEYLGPKKDVIEHPFMGDEAPAAIEEHDQQPTENTPLLSEQR